jgi:hypothetical protein
MNAMRMIKSSRKLLVGVTSIPWSLALAVGLASTCTTVGAESFADPMQPPKIVPQWTRSERATIPAPSEPLPGPLTAIWSVSGRRHAILGGETVTVGSRIGGVKIVQITDDEVVLKGPRGESRLGLNAGMAQIEKSFKKTQQDQSTSTARSIERTP